MVASNDAPEMNGVPMSRPTTFIATAALLLATVLPALAGGEANTKLHALSLVEKPAFAPDFKHFDWVNPSAPKGGMVRQFAQGSFDSLNPYPIRSNPASGLTLTTATLFVESPDEPATEYGLIAEWARFPDDYASATFGLRADAKFHDGRPITPADVIFTLDALKKASPSFQFYYKNVTSAEATGEREVTFRFDMKGNRELPHIVSQMPVLPKHWWEGKDANGNARDITRSTLEPPLGAGPYRIKEVEVGRAITFERVKDWWAKDLPVMRGQYNFDEIRFIYFQNRDAAFQTFKAGGLDFWRETTAKAWATAFDFPAVQRGAVKLNKIGVKTLAPMQSFAFNIRRPQFQDPRVREAFNLAFDFETANKQIFFDQYTRVHSYFGNSELEAKGLPTGLELDILKSMEKEVPPEVFTAEYKNPVGGSPQAARANLSKAAKLLTDAGWTRDGTILKNKAGQTLDVEMLIVSPDFERICLPYADALKALGIRASVRIVDVTQYQRRTDSFDFDMIVHGFAQSISPGNEQRDYWSSEAAGRDGSRNVIGIKNPAIDKLIDRIISAKDRTELVAATRALDRVLLWNHYVVPQWHIPYDRFAIWNQYKGPDKTPSQAVSFLRAWWYDEAMARQLGGQRTP
jgi:microcin C transport system substrate-binding protein